MSYNTAAAHNATHSLLERHRGRWTSKWLVTKLGGAGDRFGDYICVDCANLPYAGGCNQFTDTKFTRPDAQVSESTRNKEEGR